MADQAPWEKYSQAPASQASAEPAPWEKYGGSATPAAASSAPNANHAEDVPYASGDSPYTAADLNPEAMAPERPKSTGEVASDVAGEVGRGIALAGRSLVKGAAAIPDMVIAPAAGLVNKGLDALGVDPKYHQATLNQVLDQGIQEAGLPVPESTAERYIDRAGQAVAGVAGGAGTVASALRSTASPVAAGVADQIAANLPQQALAATTGAAAGQAAQDAGFGPVGELAASVGGALAPSAAVAATSLANPANIVQRAANYASTRPSAAGFTQEGRDLAARTGIDFTPGQLTGTKFQTGLENTARQSFFSADKAFQGDKKTADQAIAYLGRLMDNLNPGEVSAQGVGDKIQNTVRNVVKSLSDAREASGKQLYGDVEKIVGDAPIVQYNNTKGVLQDILQQYSDVPGAAAKTVRSQVQALLDDVNAKPAFSLDAARRARTSYGQAARRSGDIFENVNPQVQQTIAKRLYGAMSQDIDDTASAINHVEISQNPLQTQTGAITVNSGGNVGDMLRAANTNYKRYSQLIDGVENSPLSKLLGNDVVVDGNTISNLAPEEVVKRMQGLQPSQLKTVVGALQKNNPEALQEYKRLLVQNAADTAMSLPTSAGANHVPLNAGGFIRALGGNKPDQVAKLRTLFSGQEMDQIDDAFSAMRRLGDKFGANYSGTAAQAEVMNAVKNFSVRGIASTLGSVAGLRRVAGAIANSDGRQAIVALSKAKPGSVEERAAAKILNQIATQQGDSP